ELIASFSLTYTGVEMLSEKECEPQISLVVMRDPTSWVPPLLWRTMPEMVFARLQPETRDELTHVFQSGGVFSQVMASQEALGSHLADRINNWAVGLIDYLEGTYHPESEKGCQRLERKRRMVADVAALVAEEKRLGSPLADSFWKHLHLGDHRIIC